MQYKFQVCCVRLVYEESQQLSPGNGAWLNSAMENTRHSHVLILGPLPAVTVLRG